MAGGTELFDPPTRLDAALNVALAIAVLLALPSVVYAVAVPPQGEQFTEFYLLTEDQDGELVADNYPSEMGSETPATLHVGIGNNEHESVDYIVVVQLQEVAGEGNEPRVTARAELDRWSTTLDHNETAIQQWSLRIDNRTASEFEGPDRRRLSLK